MAEFDFFCTKTELVGLLKEALVDGYRVQQKKHLQSPDRQYCETADDVEAAIACDQYAFLLERSDMTRYAVQLQSADREGVTFWYLRPNEGGPVIEVYFWAPFEKDGRRVVPCSLLTHPTRIINPSTDELEPAGESVKAAFAAIVAGIRKRSRRVRSMTRTAFVMPGVDEMLAAGWSLASPFDGVTGAIT